MPEGTVIVDPPWPYEKAARHEKLTGYSNFKYEPLSIPELEKLPVREYGNYLFLWTTVAFLEKAYGLVRSWGFEPKTTIFWVKTEGLSRPPELPGITAPSTWKPMYGVGYWFRGAVEPCIIAKVDGAPSIRSNWIGLLSDNAEHSRKPDSVHQIIEADYPQPWTELFARRPRDGWRVLGNEVEGRMDFKTTVESTPYGI